MFGLKGTVDEAESQDLPIQSRPQVRAHCSTNLCVNFPQQRFDAMSNKCQT